jgi:hypothetical protein
MSFVGVFDQGRPLQGGKFTWADGTQAPFIVDKKFEP